MRVRLSSLVLCLLSVSALAALQQTQPPPTFKSRITVVPVDVRVVDRDGRPLTGLTQADFTITEDGVPQKIVHFSFHALEPQKNLVPATATLDFRKPLGETVTPPNKRIFLIVLGRGRQVGPVKGVEAAKRFIKERLLPQDHVALLAYNRATDFTNDHARLVETLDRYWKKHEWVESRLRQHFSGLAAAYGGTDIPQSIQTEIDAIFRAPGAVASRTTDGAAITGERQLDEDQRKNRELLQRAEIVKQRLDAGLSAGLDQRALDEVEMVGAEGFDEYVEKSFDTNVDLGNLYSGVRYLRLLDGEKHLVFITPRGLFLPRLEGANSLAALANDARVTIDVIHTYGTEPAQIMSARGRISMAPAFSQAFQNSTSQQIAALTGGQMTSARAGDAFFKRLDDSTRAQYLLGYTPSNGNWDGKYRRIQVRVNRPGAQVLYRHGYMGRTETLPLDRQQYLMYSRIASAANLSRVIDDVKMAIEDAATETADGKKMLRLTVKLQPGAVTMKKVEGSYIGRIETATFCGDPRGRVLGEAWNTIDFKMSEEVYQRFLDVGVSYTTRLPVTGDPRFVKAIVYDYTSDLAGSAVVDFKRK